jgi:hypothetical protein
MLGRPLYSRRPAPLAGPGPALPGPSQPPAPRTPAIRSWAWAGSLFPLPPGRHSSGAPLPASPGRSRPAPFRRHRAGQLQADTAWLDQLLWPAHAKPACKLHHHHASPTFPAYSTDKQMLAARIRSDKISTLDAPWMPIREDQDHMATVPDKTTW